MTNIGPSIVISIGAMLIYADNGFLGWGLLVAGFLLWSWPVEIEARMKIIRLEAEKLELEVESLRAQAPKEAK